MRTEQEMFALILDKAKEKECVRAVYMNGSRANPNAVKDKYQDFDIFYVVDDTALPFNDKQWTDGFGEIAVLQEPDLNDVACGEKHDFTRTYGWHLLFTDGNRIDLTICTKQAMLEEYISDSLLVLLLDKDNCMPQIPESSDKGYYIKKPTAGQYFDATSNFWWCSQNIAKGIVRDHLTYAMNMYLQGVHEKLERMVEWYIGIYNDFSVDAGMWGKYYRKYLPENLYNMYVKTYSDADYDNLWNAIFTACDLFGIIAPVVGNELGLIYNKQEEDNMREYLAKMRSNS